MDEGQRDERGMEVRRTVPGDVLRAEDRSLVRAYPRTVSEKGTVPSFLTGHRKNWGSPRRFSDRLFE